MCDEWIALLSAPAAALVSGGAAPAANRLSRKDSGADRHDETVGRVDRKIDALAIQAKETAVAQARGRILRFAYEITHRQKHSGTKTTGLWWC